MAAVSKKKTTFSESEQYGNIRFADSGSASINNEN